MIGAVIALLAFASTCFAADVELGKDGWFRTADGALFVPLGGFHGNVLPLALLDLGRAELRRVEPFLWSAQKLGGRGYLDLSDASDETLRGWFKLLAKNGVTALRLFPRARVSPDTLDLCGKLNPDLERTLNRAFAAARPYGIRFLLQILPEPKLTGYWNHSIAVQYALPRYSKQELDELTPAQRRFLIEGKHVEHTTWFTDPDVLACQKLYLESALRWVAAEPQVFALEVYNEQGTARPPPKRLAEFPANWEDAEIAWTAEIIRFIHERLPGMPVTISHPGYGLAGYDPIQWTRRTGADFYSTHFYAGTCGENADADFSAVTGAASAVLRAAGTATFPGEWGVLDDKVPREILLRAQRDALWLSLLSGASGFMQWNYDFLDEYRWPQQVFRSLPPGFSPDPPRPVDDLAAAWRAFQEDPAASSPPWFQLNPRRAASPDLRAILSRYRQSLDRGVPIRAEGGYQVACLADTAHRTWIAYLRSREIRAFGKTFLGVPVKAPLEITCTLPEGDYAADLIDLTRDRVRRLRLGASAKIPVSRNTDADYVLVITRNPAR